MAVRGLSEELFLCIRRVVIGWTLRDSVGDRYVWRLKFDRGHVGARSRRRKSPCVLREDFGAFGGVSNAEKIGFADCLGRKRIAETNHRLRGRQRDERGARAGRLLACFLLGLNYLIWTQALARATSGEQ